MNPNGLMNYKSNITEVKKSPEQRIQEIMGDIEEIKLEYQQLSKMAWVDEDIIESAKEDLILEFNSKKEELHEAVDLLKIE